MKPYVYIEFSYKRDTLCLRLSSGSKFGLKKTSKISRKDSKLAVNNFKKESN